jgi:hypothetical protein
MSARWRAATAALLGLALVAGVAGLAPQAASALPGPASVSWPPSRAAGGGVPEPPGDAATAVAGPVGAAADPSPELNGHVADLNVGNAVCGVAGVLSKLASVACGAATGGALLKGGKQLLHGNVGGAVSTVLGGSGTAGSIAGTATTALGLAATVAWVVGGAGAVLHGAATALSATTTPQLESTWFSSTYWRMAAIAALLTLPFLFAAATQAVVQSDLALLARAALGYLPLATLSIAIAAPIATLLLAASDRLCGIISTAAGDESARFITRAGLDIAGLSGVVGSPFLAFLVSLFMIAAAFALWIELLLREAAVYVIVLMLPLAFAAFVWPARRIWAIRAVELLVALILSKFAIVAVLSLGGAALATSAAVHSVTGAMAGAVLILLAAFSPWALLRLVPLAEVASGVAGLRGELRTTAGAASDRASGRADRASDWVASAAANMKREADVQMADRAEPPPGMAEPAPAGPEPPPGMAGPGPAGAEPPPGPVGGPAGDAAPTPVAATVEPSSAPPSPPPPPAPAAGSDDGAPPRSRAEEWPSDLVVELGPGGFGSTPAWRHEDAE